jgi:hypothetical protein
MPTYDETDATGSGLWANGAAPDPCTFNPIHSGGVKASGTAHNAVPCTLTYCNVVSITGSGGVVCNGSASFDGGTYVASGGVLCNGSADVNVPTQLGSGLVAWWLLGQTYNGTSHEVTDSADSLSGTGAGFGSFPDPTTGIWNCRSASSFNGYEWITFPQDNYQPQFPFTVEAWISVNSYLKARTFFSRGSLFSFGINFLNCLTASIATPAGTIFATGTTRLKQNTFYHVAAIWNPSNYFTLTINGQIERTVATTQSLVDNLTSIGYIGGLNGSALFVGDIEDVRFWAEAKDINWLQSTYANLCNSGFYTIGETYEG